MTAKDRPDGHELRSLFSRYQIAGVARKEYIAYCLFSTEAYFDHFIDTNKMDFDFLINVFAGI